MNTTTQKERRTRRVRSRVRGNGDRPRLCVFRSNRRVAVQIINDETHTTLLSLDDRDLRGAKGGAMTVRAKELGIRVAKKALASNISRVVFDRGGYAYHGVVEALAKGAREGGLEV